MTDILGFVAFLIVPLTGMWVIRLDAVRSLDFFGRMAAALAAGAVAVGVIMAAMSAAGLRWSRTSLFVAIGVLILLSAQALIRASRTFSPPRGEKPYPALSPLTGRGRRGAPGEGTAKSVLLFILVFVVISAYGILTARESAGDLHFFWGPKAVRFFRAGHIDVSYLANKNYYFAHPDYPPLLPMLFVWSHTVARQFSFWAAVASTLLFLFGSAAFVRSAAGDDDGALLMAATLSYTFAVGFAAGGADPPLIFFETVALAALTFLEGQKGADLLAAIALAGAAWTKIEGATFVIAVVIALLLVRRQFLRALRIAVPAAILLGAWLLFLKVNGLVDLYRGATMGIFWNALPNTLKLVAKTGAYELYGLPWIIPIVLLAFGNIRRAAFPLAVALLTLGAAIFFYIHLADPTWWIMASAPRVLLTPLTALLVAAVAARRSPALC